MPILKSRSFEMPYFGDHIVAGRSNHPVLAIELHTRHKMLMRFYFFLFFSEIEVPYSDCFIVRGRI